MTQPVLKSGFGISKVGKNFGKRPVLMGIDITVSPGEIVGLLGPNGAGKTTSFSILSGLLAPDTGVVYLNEQDITRIPMYQRARMGIGYLPQESSIFRGLSVEQNILSVLELLVKDTDERQQRLDLLLDQFSISHLRQASALSLSGGERRRVEIARALALTPSFLLLDEPFAGIDPIAVGEIRDFIVRLKKMGLGVLITDHNVRETLDIVDRAYIISQGQVLMEGLPANIISHADVRRIYLGERFSL